MPTYKQCDAQGYLKGNVENSLRGEMGLEDEDVYIVWISTFCGIREKSRAEFVSQGVGFSGAALFFEPLSTT